MKIWLVMAVAVIAAATGMAQEPRFRVNRYDHLSTQELYRCGNVFLNNRARIDSALIYYSMTANRYGKGHQSMDDIRHSSMAMRKLGFIYSSFHKYINYPLAYSWFLRAEAVDKKYDFQGELASVYSHEADMYQMLHQSTQKSRSPYLSRAIEIFRQAQQIARREGNDKHLCDHVFNLLAVCLEYDTLEASRQVATDYLHLTARHPTHATHMSQATLDCIHRDYPSALANLDRSLDAMRKLNPRNQAECNFMALNIKSIVMERAGYPTRQVAEPLWRCIEIARDIQSTDAAAKAYKHLYHVMEKGGNRAEADRYRLRYLELNDSMVGVLNLHSLENVQLQADLKDANEQMIVLAQEKRMNTRVMWLSLAFSVLVLGILLTLGYTYKQLKRRSKDLYLKNLDLLATSEQLRQQLITKTAPAESEERLEPVDNEADPALLSQIMLVMETSSEVYSEDFSLDRLAELVGANKRQVSQAINAGCGKTYKVLVSEYRIKEACRRMNDVANYGNFTLEGIAASVGIKSRTNFVKLFKNQVGITPSVYLRYARQNPDGSATQKP